RRTARPAASASPRRSSRSRAWTTPPPTPVRPAPTYRRSPPPAPGPAHGAAAGGEGNPPGDPTDGAGARPRGRKRRQTPSVRPPASLARTAAPALVTAGRAPSRRGRSRARAPAETPRARGPSRRERSVRCRPTRARSDARRAWRARLYRAPPAAGRRRCRDGWPRPARGRNRPAGRRAPGRRGAWRRARAGRPHRAAASRPGEIDADQRQVPMRREDLEAPLLLAPEGVLVGEQALELGFGERFVRRGGVLPHDRDAIVPAAVFGAVKTRRFRADLLRVTQLDLPLQHREMVLLEESDELVGIAPADLVVVLHHERLARSRRRRLGDA